MEFLRKGIDEHVANSILIKVNQIGTLSETLDAIKLAHDNNYTADHFASLRGDRRHNYRRHRRRDECRARSKTGSLSRTDRVAKYNQLLRIAEELGDNAVYGGKMR